MNAERRLDFISKMRRDSSFHEVCAHRERSKPYRSAQRARIEIEDWWNKKEIHRQSRESCVTESGDQSQKAGGENNGKGKHEGRWAAED